MMSDITLEEYAMALGRIEAMFNMMMVDIQTRAVISGKDRLLDDFTTLHKAKFIIGRPNEISTI